MDKPAPHFIALLTLPIPVHFLMFPTPLPQILVAAAITSGMHFGLVDMIERS